MVTSTEETKTQHTLGPWEVSAKITASENHRGFFIRAEKVTRNGKWALAEVQPGDEDGKLGAANARLIAAAPELLEALEPFAKFACDVPGCGCHNCRARDAIRKARGE